MTDNRNISAIVAVASNGAIGRNNALLWHISEDLKFFKRTTLGHTVIMGFNTFLSMGSRPLPGRRNIVINRINGQKSPEGVEFFPTLESAIEAASEGDKEPFIIGGGKIYKASMKYIDKLYVTQVDKVVEEADTFFPPIDPKEWQMESSSEWSEDPKSGYRYRFVSYIKTINNI